MRRSVCHRFLMLLGSFLILTSHASASLYPENGPEGKLYFWRQDTQEHFWLSAMGSFAAAQIYQYYGMDRTPAIVLATLEVGAAGVAKAYLIDSRPGLNALSADAMGLLLGTILNVTIRFDFPRQKSCESRDVEEVPAQSHQDNSVQIIHVR